LRGGLVGRVPQEPREGGGFQLLTKLGLGLGLGLRLREAARGGAAAGAVACGHVAHVEEEGFGGEGSLDLVHVAPPPVPVPMPVAVPGRGGGFGDDGRSVAVGSAPRHDELGLADEGNVGVVATVRARGRDGSAETRGLWVCVCVWGARADARDVFCVTKAVVGKVKMDEGSGCGGRARKTLKQGSEPTSREGPNRARAVASRPYLSQDGESVGLVSEHLLLVALEGAAGVHGAPRPRP